MQDASTNTPLAASSSANTALSAHEAQLRQDRQHLRMQRIRQRAQQNAIQIAHDSLVEVNPEFLAALPLNIQSEVLMQQRIEQQRQAAQTANPEDPVDTAAFFQNLPENLRQAVSFGIPLLQGFELIGLYSGIIFRYSPTWRSRR